MQTRQAVPNFCYAIAVLAAGIWVSSCAVTGKNSTPSTNPAISITPSSISFGNVKIDSIVNKSIKLTNTGTAPLAISRATLTGANFLLSGLTTPSTVAAGASMSFTIAYKPTAVGSNSGSVSIANDASDSPVTVSMVGTGVSATTKPSSAPEISLTPSSLNFGSVTVDTNATRTIKLSNTGSAALAISQVKTAGSGFSISGLTAPSSVAAGSSVTFTVAFKPITAAATDSGSISIASDASDSMVTISLAGAGVSATTKPPSTPEISVTPSSVNFGNVTVSSNTTQTIKLSNGGTAALTISQVKTAGSGFSISGLAAPSTIAAGSSTTFTVAFKPTAAGADSGSVSITSNASSSPLVIDLAGAGATSSVKLSASVTNLGFGNVAVGKAATQQLQLTNTGNAQVSISSASIAGTGFSASGGTNVNLAPGQSVNVTVGFDPKSTGALSGTLTISSNAAPLKISLTGTGTQQSSLSQHTVTLSWSPSTSSDVIGYFVYRRTGSTGGFTKLQGTVDSSTSFTDSNVADGQTYFYVVTSVAEGDAESAFSSPVEVTIPSA